MEERIRSDWKKNEQGTNDPAGGPCSRTYKYEPAQPYFQAIRGELGSLTGKQGQRDYRKIIYGLWTVNVSQLNKGKGTTERLYMDYGQSTYLN